MSEHDADTKALEEFRRLIEESPLGTLEARAIRARVPRERAERLAQRLAADTAAADSTDVNADPFDQQLRDLLSALAPAPRPASESSDRPTTAPRWGMARQILVALAKITEEVTGIDPSEVTFEKSLVDDLDIDALSQVEIAVQLEHRFGIKIPDEDLAGLRTVGDYVAYVERVEEQRVEQASPPPAVIDAPAAVIDSIDSAWWDSM